MLVFEENFINLREYYDCFNIIIYEKFFFYNVFVCFNNVKLDFIIFFVLKNVLYKFFFFDGVVWMESLRREMLVLYLNLFGVVCSENLLM